MEHRKSMALIMLTVMFHMECDHGQDNPSHSARDRPLLSTINVRVSLVLMMTTNDPS